MSKSKKEHVIKVDNLVIHAKEVKIITEDKHDDDHHERRRDPWGIIWGRRPSTDREDNGDD